MLIEYYQMGDYFYEVYDKKTYRGISKYNKGLITELSNVNYEYLNRDCKLEFIQTIDALLELNTYEDKKIIQAILISLL